MVAFWKKIFKKKEEKTVKEEKVKVAPGPKDLKARKEKKKVVKEKVEKKKVAPVKKKVEKKKTEVKPQEKPKTEVKVLKAKSDSKLAEKILIRPLITEKSALLGSEGKYSFEIAPKTNKTEVARAIYDLYGERPLSVNIIRVRGKRLRYGRTQGQRKNWKKAIITFKPGVKLEVFEGV